MSPVAELRHSARGAADDLRRYLGTLDLESAGAEMHAAVRELFPEHRSITGEGLRRSLRALQRIAPVVVHEVPTGTPVFDWVVPPEWSVRGARLIAPDGTVLADFQRLNLHLMAYSVPFRGKVRLEDLDRHLHSLPEHPTLVPYRTSYYREDWGFCLSHELRARLGPGEYEVDIDTSLAAGSLSYGEVVVPGTSDEEVLVSAHACHPSLANDNLSGMVVAATLARIVGTAAPRFTYRFVFAPGTIGAITWLARNVEAARRVKHGLVIACVGDSGRLRYKASRRGDAEIDRAVAHVLAHHAAEHEVSAFTPDGGDERQYCSPGFDLAVGSLSRTANGAFREFHSSADDVDYVSADRLADSLRVCLEVFALLEGNLKYRNLSPYCEPQLGKRGLYGTGRRLAAMLWVLNLSDGTRTLLDIAERAAMAFPEVHEAARALESAGLLGQVA